MNIWKETIKLAHSLWAEQADSNDPRWGQLIDNLGQIITDDIHYQASSNVTSVEVHPAFLVIVEAGDKVLPWLIKKYAKNPRVGHWCPMALGRITGEKVIKASSAGRSDKIREDWLEWAKNKGYEL